MIFSTVSTDERKFLGELYKRYYSCWYMTAYEMVHNEETAKDMVNETFVKIINSKRNLTEFDKNAAFTFVIKSLKNTCLTYLAKASNSKVNYLDEETLRNISDNISVEDVCIRNADIETMRRVISKLNEKEQLFVILHFYEDLSDKEIAVEMNMKYNNIRMYRSRLILKIKKMFSKESKVSKHE